MSLLKKTTRFRAYQLGTAGSSYSYFDGQYFTLVEARVTDVNRPQIIAELKNCGKSTINTLHITSWDNDHCALADLTEILDTWTPGKIEYPGYEPHTETGKECLKLIKAHKTKKPTVSIVKVDPDYITSLNKAQTLGYKDIVYHPKYLSDKSNDNSTIKFFRTGCFNVASLGDAESSSLSAHLKRCSVFKSETDVLILPHHGADNGFITKDFLQKVKPALAICTSNYDNQYAHPADKIRKILHELNIPVFTTKTGDVIVKSIGAHTQTYQVFNYISNSETLSSIKKFFTKKSVLLSRHQDNINDHYAKKNPFKRFY